VPNLDQAEAPLEICLERYSFGHNI